MCFEERKKNERKTFWMKKGKRQLKEQTRRDLKQASKTKERDVYRKTSWKSERKNFPNDIRLKERN